MRRDFMWSHGGGPVWYARGDVLPSTTTLDERTRSWIVPTTPPRNEWLHEREWRLPMPDAAATGVALGDGLVAILVADPTWEPGAVTELDINPMTGGLSLVEQTPSLATVPRWYWDGTGIRVLAPVEVRVHGYHGF